MADRIAVFVYSHDPVYQAGLTGQLRDRPELRLVSETEVDDAVVAVVAADELDEVTTRALRALQRGGCPRVVLVLGYLDEERLLDAVAAGACGLLRRSEATPERLVESINSAARGDGTVPPDLLGRLLVQVGRAQREGGRGLSLRRLEVRETEVLRLLSEGLDTAEVADQLAYSERTVKNVLHAVTTRLQLRNRTHAVAYAVREGLI
jgi:DNA-binding NarL/FixJ family response regulator